MIKSICFLLLLALFVSACDTSLDFSKKEIQHIDFTSIDAYPEFPSCDSLTLLEFKQNCFETTASKIIQSDLDAYGFSASKPISDVILVHFEIDNNGKASLYKTETSNSVKETLPKIDSIIKESIINFPTLRPAKKQNINVTCRFIVPVYVMN